MLIALASAGRAVYRGGPWNRRSRFHYSDDKDSDRYLASIHDSKLETE